MIRTRTAQTALDKIRAIHKYPIPTVNELATQRILKNLGLSDYIAVCAALEAKDGSVPRG